jgi:sodium pump decarboxylase gamma subunit
MVFCLLAAMTTAVMAQEPIKTVAKEPVGEDAIIRSLIYKLGDADLATREKASTQLRKLGDVALPFLKKHLARRDLERTLRARELYNDIIKEQRLKPTEAKDMNIFSVAITGMIIVFFALFTLTLFLTVLPKALEHFNKYFPPTEHGHGQAAVKRDKETLSDDAVAALAVALLHHRGQAADGS